jgi:hypothetical protein
MRVLALAIWLAAWWIGVIIEDSTEESSSTAGGISTAIAGIGVVLIWNCPD